MTGPTGEEHLQQIREDIAEAKDAAAEAAHSGIADSEPDKEVAGRFGEGSAEEAAETD